MKQIKKAQSESFPNYEFYNRGDWNQLKPKVKEILLQFHQQRHNHIPDLQSFYQSFEYDHQFIQWLFPNFYSSKFNPNSYKLTIEERKKMAASRLVLKRVYKNYILILRFFGIVMKYHDLYDNTDKKVNEQQKNNKNQIENNNITQQTNSANNQNIIQENKTQQNDNLKQKTIKQYFESKTIQKEEQTQNNSEQKNNEIEVQVGENQVQENDTSENFEISWLELVDRAQFEKCCTKNVHNLLRLRRIIGSLSVLKHRKEAIQFCQFLEKELIKLGKKAIYDEYLSGYDIYFEELSEKEQKKIPIEKRRFFNGFKSLYVENDLVEQIDISIIQ